MIFTIFFSEFKDLFLRTKITSDSIYTNSNHTTLVLKEQFVQIIVNLFLILNQNSTILYYALKLDAGDTTDAMFIT